MFEYRGNPCFCVRLREMVLQAADMRAGDDAGPIKFETRNQIADTAHGIAILPKKMLDGGASRLIAPDVEDEVMRHACCQKSASISDRLFALCCLQVKAP